MTDIDNSEYPVQYSKKVGDDILVVRANSGEDFKAKTEDILKALDETADRWVEIQQLILGKSVVAGGVVGSPDSQVAAQVVAPTPSAPPPGPAGEQHPCPHGMRVYKSGATWAAWMCPSPKGTPGQCKPLDAKTGKLWS